MCIFGVCVLCTCFESDLEHLGWQGSMVRNALFFDTCVSIESKCYKWELIEFMINKLRDEFMYWGAKILAVSCILQGCTMYYGSHDIILFVIAIIGK